jgi:hypothetical protein
MANEQFDDEKLQNLARYNMYANGEVDASERGKVEKLVKKEKLDNSERNELLSFIDSRKKFKPMSMKDMKNEIMRMIGAEPSTAYSNVPNAREIEAIYKWFVENFKKAPRS